ncbi:hypothetical protein G6O69_10475 [Pseudenhygromyxa sp. WMMC2535]|nr:hypothetical protein [Pseudenhygromyxa sp. WMMC2535]NVB38256.1 hypothetical protein [Pseudenhygromyxa sp. WMMC2535]
MSRASATSAARLLDSRDDPLIFAQPKLGIDASERPSIPGIGLRAAA